MKLVMKEILDHLRNGIVYADHTMQQQMQQGESIVLVVDVTTANAYNARICC